MSARTTPPFRADHVGSLIRPKKLMDARDARAKGTMPAAELAQIQHDAIRDVVKLQEDVGLRVATDGEYNRGGWSNGFIDRFENVKSMKSKFTAHFHNEHGTAEGAVMGWQVSGKLKRKSAIFVDDFKFLKSIAKATPKIELPSPSMMHFRGGRDAIDRAAYPDMEEFYQDLARCYREEIADLADAGCRYFQLDEVNLAYLCDPAMRAQVQNIGEDPASLPATYAKLINNTIAGRPKDMVACIHLCRGNSSGQWMAEGGYDPIAEMLFNEINVDGYFLEYDSPRAGSFEPLRFVPKGKMVVLGLITTKHGKIEQKDELKRRIDEASKYVPLDQLALSPQCGFSPGITNFNMAVDEEITKLKLLVETAREVWGST